MLGKILLTALVIVTAFFVIRHRTMMDDGPARNTSTADNKDNNKKEQKPGELRFVAYSFLGMVLALAAGMYYFRWRDDHTLLTVTLYPGNQAAPVTYEVYKYQLGERSFTTTDGTSITVAASERMEIRGLD